MTSVRKKSNKNAQNKKGFSPHCGKLLTLPNPPQQQLKKQVHQSKQQPRFVDNKDGTVTDNETGLVWLKNASCLGKKTWYDAKKAAEELSSGKCGLKDGSKAGQWRLPTEDELRGLIDTGKGNLSGRLNKKGFKGIRPSWYWTYNEPTTFYAFDVNMWDGHLGIDFTVNTHYVWPVRSGK